MGLGKRLSDFFNLSGAKKQPSPAEVAAFIVAATEGSERAVRKFCKNYPDHVDAPDKAGQTALNAAVRSNQIAVGEILLDAKADPNKPAVFGESPFLTCIAFSFYNPGDYRLLDRMLKSGANVNFQQKAWVAEGFRQAETLTTPLMNTTSFQNEKLCDYLLKNGANPLLKDNGGKTARDHVRDFIGGPIGNAPDETTGRIIARLKKAEEEWASRPTSEWRGKVDPNIHTWQGH
jgi:ankyrin repeat protein